MHLQGIEMKLTRFFSTMVILLLSGCTLGFDATFEDLSLLREEPADIVGQYSLPGREAPGSPPTGMLRLDFTANTDLFELMNEEYNLWFKAKTCQSMVDLVSWSNLYQNLKHAPDKSKNLHHYSVFLDPSWSNPQYDLKLNPEPICVQFGAGQLAGLSNYRSNTVTIGRDKVMAAFETRK